MAVLSPETASGDGPSRLTAVLGFLCLAVQLIAADGGWAASTNAPVVMSAEQKLWALAAAGVLTERNRDRHDLLGGCETNEAGIKDSRACLKDWWGVESREDLLDALRRLRTGGHRQQFEAIGRDVSTLTTNQMRALREQMAGDPEMLNRIGIAAKHYPILKDKSLYGWDYSRYIAVAGWGYVSGYITEAAAWGFILPAARILQKKFTSWEDLGANYVIGREFWSLKYTQENGADNLAAYRRLCQSPDSPWQKLPWDLDLNTPPAVAHPTGR